MASEVKNPGSFSAQQKVAILRKHLLEHVPVSDLCDEHGITPKQFYNWQKRFFEHGTAAFERDTNGPSRRLERANDALKGKLAEKDEVIAEIMASHLPVRRTQTGVVLKKSWPNLSADRQV